MNSNLSRWRKIIAGASYHQDVIEYLQELANDVSDVRTPIGNTDTVELRKALSTYLHDEAQNIEQERALNERPHSESNDDV